MSNSELIALVSVIVSPVSVLVAVWLTSRLAARQKAEEAARAMRAAALEGFSRFASLVLDSHPELVVTGSIREYSSPEAAVAGLYTRWLSVREPLVLLGFAHPSESVRRLALRVQALLELSLRQTEDAVRADGDVSGARRTYDKCDEASFRLGQLLAGNSGDQGEWVTVTSILTPLE